VAGTVTGDATKAILGFLNNANSLQVVIGSSTVPTTAFWAGSLNGNWNGFNSTASTNWRVSATGADTNALPVSTSDVTFATTSPTPGTLATTLGQNFTINSLTFSSSISSATSIAGPATLTIGGAAGITNSSSAGGAITISAPVALGIGQTWTNNNTTDTMIFSAAVTNGANNLTITGAGNIAINAVLGNGAGSLTKSGAGTLTLGGANTYTGSTVLNTTAQATSSCPSSVA